MIRVIVGTHWGDAMICPARKDRKITVSMSCSLAVAESVDHLRVKIYSRLHGGKDVPECWKSREQTAATCP